MVFRLNLTIEIPMPSGLAKPDGGDDNASLAPAHPTPNFLNDDAEELNLAQYARQQPRISLRTLAFVATVAGLILNSVAQSAFWYGDVYDVCSAAFVLLCISFIWQPLEIFWQRLFPRRGPLKSWFLITIETLGFVAFLALFVSGVMVGLHGYRSLEDMDVPVVMLYTWNTVPWAILFIVHFICMIQCARQAARNKRIAKCPKCNTDGRVRDEEQGLLGHAGHVPEHTGEVEERYRDEES